MIIQFPLFVFSKPHYKVEFKCIERSLFDRPFPSCCEPHYESKAKCKTFHMKISFVCRLMKTYSHIKNFALSLAFIMRFKATRKWSIILIACVAGVTGEGRVEQEKGREKEGLGRARNPWAHGRAQSPLSSLTFSR